MNDTHILKAFDALVTELNETQGTNAKIGILKEHRDLEPLIKRIWDPMTKTHVTKKGLETWRKKHPDDPERETKFDNPPPETLYDLIDALTSSKLTGDRAKAAVWCYIERHPKYEELILRIMEKNPRIRLGETMLLKAFPGMFTIFKVCLSDKWTEKDFEKAYNAAGKKAWISKKIDGMRLITKILPPALDKDDHGHARELAQVKFYSRKGHEVTSLDVLRQDILRHLVPHLDADEIREGRVLDGEVVALNKDGTENFKLTISEARKKDATMPNPMYMLFDYLPLPVFEERAKGERFGERLEQLRDFAGVLPRRCKILEQTPWSPEAFERLRKEAAEKSFEGLMVRVDAPYEAKRTRNLLKYKFSETEEFRVEKLIIDPKYPFPNRTGGEDRMPALAAVIIKHKGHPVQVGSGFDKLERLEFAENPEKIKGKIISVNFQEEFYDEEKNKWSLRCPIFKGIVGDKEREV
jgi:DNA ligase-1